MHLSQTSHSYVQKRQGSPKKKSPGEGQKDYEGPGASLVRGKAE